MSVHEHISRTACPVVKVGAWAEGSGGTTLLLYFAFALVHDSRGIEIVNFTISLALSGGTLMASAGTPYRLVPAHFYPCARPMSNDFVHVSCYPWSWLEHSNSGKKVSIRFHSILATESIFSIRFDSPI